MKKITLFLYIALFAATMSAQQVAPPVFSVKGGIYTKVEGLYFTSETPDAKVLYNKRGGDPRTEGDRLYAGMKETVLSSTTINAVAYIKDADGKTIYSDVVSEYYEISPLSLYRFAEELKDSCYLINCGEKIAVPLFKHVEQGSFSSTGISLMNEEYIETNAFYGFGFNAVEGGFTIRDPYGRYMYPGEGNKFRFADDMPAEGAVWSVDIAEETCSAVITNVHNGKSIAYDVQSNTFGAYAEEEFTENHLFPNLFAKIAYPSISITPEDGDTLTEFSKVTVTCESGITYNETDNLYAYYNVGNDSKKNEFVKISTIDANTIEFSLRKPLTANNEYKVVFPAGVLTLNPEGVAHKNKEIKAVYTVKNLTTLEVTYANPDNNATAKDLQFLYFEFNQDIAINTTDAVITDKTGKQYPLTVSEKDTWGSVCASYALCLKTEAPLAPGEYTFVLKREYASAKTDENIKLDKDITYRFISAEGLKVADTTPANEAVCSSVDKIVLEFNKPAMHDSFSELTVTGPDGETYTFAKESAEENASSLTFTAQSAITAVGTYTFTVYSYNAYCEDANSLDGMEYVEEATFTFTIDQSNGIENVTAENVKSKTAYDLTGRRTDNITKAGIYIVNGNKIIIR